MGDDPRLALLFSKYLRRHCTAEEVVELIGLLQEADASETLSAPMRALWEQVKGENTEYAVDWDKMYAVVSNTEEDLITLNQRRNRKLRRTWFRLAAACILGLTILGVGLVGVEGWEWGYRRLGVGAGSVGGGAKWRRSS